MNFITIALLFLVFVFTGLLIYGYAAKNTPVYVYFFVFIGYFMGFALVVLIPYDIAIVNASQTLSQDSARQESLLVIWDVVYWAVFCLCWVILPVIQ